MLWVRARGGADERFPPPAQACFESWRWRSEQFSCWLAEQVRRGGAEGRGPEREGGHRARGKPGPVAWANPPKLALAVHLDLCLSN